MGRSGKFLGMVLAGLAVCALLYLLFSDELGAGAGPRGYSAVADLDETDEGLDAEGTGLAAAGQRPKTPEELAAEAAARDAAARAFPPEHGFHGRVTDGKGRAMKGAVVKLLSDSPEMRRRPGTPDGPALATTATGEDGAYLLGPAPESGQFKLRAEASGYAPTIQAMRQRGVRVDLILDRGGQLVLRVLDPQGEPVGGAHVLHHAGAVVSVADTGEDGIARFAALPTGTGSLLVTKQGFGAVRDGNVAVAPDRTEERTLVLARGLDIVGTVTDASTSLPVEGASVTIRYQNLPGSSPEGPVTTEADGRFRLTAYASGQEQLIVRAEKSGFAEGRVWHNAAATGEVSLVLHKAAEAVTGRVTGPDRQPMAEVVVTFSDQGHESAAEIPQATSEPDGAYTLPVPPWATPGWNLTVLASSRSHGIAIGPYVVPKPGVDAPKTVDLELGGVGTVQGVVRDAGAQPVQGALVTLQPDWNAGAERPGRKRVAWELMRVLYDGAHHDLSAVTGADGAYVIREVPALEYRITAAFGLDQFTPPDPVVVTSAEVTQADIALGEGGTIEGWVLDDAQKPIAGAYVYVTPTATRGGQVWFAGRATGRSQSDGRFVLRGVGDERYTLWANASGFGNASENNVGPGAKEVTLRLKALGWIQGVVQAEGVPYRGVFDIVATGGEAPRSSRGAPMPAGWSPGSQPRTFNTDDGRFEVRGLTAGDYTVRASTREGLISAQPQVVTVVDGRASRETRLDLLAGAVLRGAVRNDESGTPIPRAWVYASPRQEVGADPGGATHGNGQTDAQGCYEIRGLGTGTYTVTVWSPTGANFSTTVDLVVGTERDLDLVELRPGSIETIVVDEEDAPVPGVRVHVMSANGNYVNVNVAAMQKEGLLGASFDWQSLWNTGSDGRLVRSHIAPGPHTVWGSKRGYEMVGDKVSVSVGAGAVTQVRLQMKPN